VTEVRHPRGGWGAAAFAAACSIYAFLYYFRHDQLLLYGDAVAHMNIARRVFDSRAPGPLQLGTVWLPLPHILMLPFVAPLKWWQNGVGGAVVSMAAYVAGAAGVFRTVLLGLSEAGIEDDLCHAGAWAGTLVFVANPNLLYMQATAMTEALFVALMVWAVYFLLSFTIRIRAHDDRAGQALVWCGVMLTGAEWTRYDAWFYAAIIGVLVLLVLFFQPTVGRSDRSGFAWFLVLCGGAGAIWLAYNYVLSGHPLDFALGPYSAKAIEQRTSVPGMTHPGANDLWVALLYFIKTAKLNLGAGAWEMVLLILSVLGSAAVAARRYLWPLLVLWLPVIFYPLSIAYGSVPTFIPPWWPHSYYNVRYGLQLLPVVAVFVGVLAGMVASFFTRHSLQSLAVLAVFGAMVGSYYSTWASPICLEEAKANSRTRITLESTLAEQLQKLPESATLLMNIGDHGGALQRAGIRLNRTINETSRHYSEGHYGEWERALAEPRGHAQYLVAFAGDEVAKSAAEHKDELSLVVAIQVPGQPRATVYHVNSGLPSFTRH
jgi:hypothetical protein